MSAENLFILVLENLMECGKAQREEVAVTGERMLSKVEEQTAGCIENGVREHWLCTECSVLFSDKDAGMETTAEELFKKEEILCLAKCPLCMYLNIISI